MKLKVKYLFPNIPELISQEGDSGFDVRAAIEEPIKIAPFGRVTVPTGVAVEFINQSYAPSCSAELQVRPRSGLTARGIVAQFGTIDLSYRGEISITIFNFNNTEATIEPLDRIAQLVVSEAKKAVFSVSRSLSDTERGEKGFGSTGV